MSDTATAARLTFVNLPVSDLAASKADKMTAAMADAQEEAA
ncbi:hypothetical protein [Sphingomonas sp. ID0503]